MSGFLRKKPKITKFQPHMERWVFLISSRPLNQEQYVLDTEILSADMLPSLIEFDTIYYFGFDNSEDDSS